MKAAKSEVLAPGTRCACDTFDEKHQRAHISERHCTRDAVRMVTVPEGISTASLLRYKARLAKKGITLPPPQLPMCSACAEWWISRDHDGVMATIAK